MFQESFLSAVDAVVVGHVNALRESTNGNLGELPPPAMIMAELGLWSSSAWVNLVMLQPLSMKRQASMVSMPIMLKRICCADQMAASPLFSVSRYPQTLT
ncbi:hypothetical protein KCU98_g23, partial [Aureobasidium melanogenum]